MFNFASVFRALGRRPDEGTRLRKGTVIFETLEPRLLLSADVAPAATFMAMEAKADAFAASEFSRADLGGETGAVQDGRPSGPPATLSAAKAGDDTLSLLQWVRLSEGGWYPAPVSAKASEPVTDLATQFSPPVTAKQAIVDDVNKGGEHLSGLDASRVLQKISSLSAASAADRTGMPATPPAIGPLGFSGLDPVVDIPIDASATVGELITVPVRIDMAAGLESANLRIAYDASRLELVAVRRGSLTGEFGWYVTASETGRMTVDMTRLGALQGGSGTLLDIDLRVRADAPPGVAAIDLQYASLNGGRLMLNVVPQAGPDASDGRITIGGAAATDRTAELRATRPAKAVDETLPLAQRLRLLEGGWYSMPAAGNTSGSEPVIDFAARFLPPAALDQAIFAGFKSKPWLKDYLADVGPARGTSPIAGLKSTVPVAAR